MWGKAQNRERYKLPRCLLLDLEQSINAKTQVRHKSSWRLVLQWVSLEYDITKLVNTYQQQILRNNIFNYTECLYENFLVLN